MRNKLFITMILGFFLCGFTQTVLAQQIPDNVPADQYMVARILSIERGRQDETMGMPQQFLNITVQVLSGLEKGREVVIEDEDRFGGDLSQEPRPGEKVTVVKVWNTPTEFVYRVDDRYRLPALGWILALFLALVIFFGRRKGAGSILGLTASILILLYYIAPQLIAGANPTRVTLTGAFMIAICSILLGHGPSKRTFIALGSTLLTLIVSVVLANFFVRASQLFGMGSEEAFYLQIGGTTAFDLRGLLLGGIIIGMLGILDDVTTAQSATVEELKKANNRLSFLELYRRGLSVGKEHIASLVNTLVLAYVGASLPLFLLFTINSETVPGWVLLNSEFMAEEIVRALAGSVALVLAVPISTFLAARFFAPRKDEVKNSA